MSCGLLCICVSKGGGSLHWVTKASLHLDGLITAKGTTNSPQAGGGSGGSILIEALNMSESTLTLRTNMVANSVL